MRWVIGCNKGCSKGLLVSMLLLSYGLLGFGAARAEVVQLTVKGNQVFRGEKPAVLAGNSLFWSNTGWGGERFYTPETLVRLKKDWGSRLVRAAMGVEGSGGYLEDPENNRRRAMEVIEAAIEEDIYIIIDWHAHHAEKHTQAAVDFFADIARKYGQYPHLIYEIYNEPLDLSWEETLKPYARKVIQAIRAEDPDNVILMGTPNWSQDVDLVAQSPLDTVTNVAYTLHFYAGTHGDDLRRKARVALEAGLPLFVSEWGTVNANGDGEPDRESTRAWLEFMGRWGISHANWAVNDKTEGASVLKPGAEPRDLGKEQALTPSGRLVKDLIAQWYEGAFDPAEMPAH